jgi:hypothetical protein
MLARHQWLTLATWEAEIRKKRPAWGNSSPELQNNQNKMDWRCGSSSRVRAFYKCKALSSNPSPTKRKERKEGGREEGGNGLW